MFHYFIDSVNTKNKIEIIYLSKNYKITQRTIRVIQIDGDKILAYCFTKKQVRIFKIDSILAAFPIKKGIGA